MCLRGERYYMGSVGKSVELQNDPKIICKSLIALRVSGKIFVFGFLF